MLERNYCADNFFYRLKVRSKWFIASSSIKYITMSDRFDFAVKSTTLIHKHKRK